MNAWKTIKRLAGEGGKVVVVEGDEATHVVLTVEEYERLMGSAPVSPRPIYHMENMEEDSPETHPGSIRIEDLPL